MYFSLHKNETFVCILFIIYLFGVIDKKLLLFFIYMHSVYKVIQTQNILTQGALNQRYGNFSDNVGKVDIWFQIVGIPSTGEKWKDIMLMMKYIGVRSGGSLQELMLSIRRLFQFHFHNSRLWTYSS